MSRYHQPSTRQTMLLSILILSLRLINAFEDDNDEPSEHLDKTSLCIKDLPPLQPLKFNLYPATYEELIKQNDFFIDKTLLLEEIFAKNTSFLTVFYLPRKFSKSINLQMIRTFAEIILNSSYSIARREDTFAYNFFTRGKITHKNGIVELLKEPPLISHNCQVIDEHLGQYPVIYLNFSVINDVDFIASWNSLKDSIGKEFRKYSFLKSRTNATDSVRFHKLIEYFIRTEGVEDRERMVELMSSLECLANTVTGYFNKKPILMVDEYDSLIDSFLHDRYASKTEDDMAIKYFMRFRYIFGNSTIWHRVIMTGTYSIFKNRLDQLPVSKTIYHTLANNLSYYFGFTENDLKLLSNSFKITDYQLEQVRKHYKGYRMGRHFPIYNPWSILKYLETKQLENHWEVTFKHINFLRNLFLIDKMRNVWIGLLGDRTRCVTHNYEMFNERDMWILKITLATDHRISALSPRKFTQALMYLADTGHLTWMRYKEPAPDKTFNVWLPNQAAKQATFLRLKAAYTQHLNVKTSLVDEAASKLHWYLASDRSSGQVLLDVMRAFQLLYNKTSPVFDNDRKYREPKPKPVARHIVDYLGLRMKYSYDYKIDPMFMSGFLLRKDNISYFINFNYNQTIESGDILERIKNLTHPWTVLRLETKMVKYVVVSIANDSDEAHILSYAVNLPPDYTPPLVLASDQITSTSNFRNETDVVASDKQYPSTEKMISTIPCNGSRVSMQDLPNGIESAKPFTTILENSTNAVEIKPAESFSENHTTILASATNANVIESSEPACKNFNTTTAAIEVPSIVHENNTTVEETPVNTEKKLQQWKPPVKI